MNGAGGGLPWGSPPPRLFTVSQSPALAGSEKAFLEVSPQAEAGGSRQQRVPRGGAGGNRHRLFLDWLWSRHLAEHDTVVHGGLHHFRNRRPIREDVLLVLKCHESP